MPIKVSCNSCGGVLHAPDDSAGKRGRCPTCGTILAIPADGPRVSSDSAAPSNLGVPPPQPASSYGLAPPEPLAFPRPPAFGAPEGTKSSFGSTQRATSAPGALASRLPPDPRKGTDPFSKPSSPSKSDPVAQRWHRVRTGLGLVRRGLFAWMLALLAPSLLAILEQNGVPLPSQNPGLLGATGLSLADEIKVGLAVGLFTLGGLMIVIGRLRFSGVPRASGARGLARAAALATIISFGGFLIAIILAISATLQGAVPKLIPHSDVLAPYTKLQNRIEGYCQHLFLDTADFTGQLQRYGFVAMLVFGALAELWFFGALGRLAVHLRSDRAMARVSRFVIGVGLLAAIVMLYCLWFDMSGRRWMDREVWPQWNALAPGLKIALRAGIAGAIGLTVLFWKSRVVNGVRHAVAETTDAA